ncbi:MAG: sn-glycerol-3-phosphate ABC transporter ATP-binding protein UgpC [Holophagaceae bacterium]|nr:sn-glycerol-3-phosphate ABC transporter ATP-binding protein UgpC [Holophagaceae bacterium]
MGDLQIKSLHKSFGDVKVLQGLDLDIQDGEFVVFVGPSGCGKSTLLRCIAGLEEVTSGEIHIGGKRVDDVPPSKRGIAMVFQSYALYPHMTVAENMAFGLKLAGASKQEIAAAVDHAAEILQIQPLLDRLPKALSGGQRQRVAIGRAIVRKPGVFLFDEPLSNLDASLRVKMRVELARLHSELKTTMVYVTHDQVEAMTLAKRIVVINMGRIEQVGTPLEVYHQPSNTFVAGFIGSPKMNFMECALVSADEALATVKLSDGAVLQVRADARTKAEGEKLTLGIRPEHISASQTEAHNSLHGRVQVAERLGDTTFLYMDSASTGDTITVKTDPENTLNAGDEAHMSFPRHHCYLFDSQGQTLPRTPRVRA